MPNQRAAFGWPSDLPRSLTAGLAFSRQPPFALNRTVDTGRVANSGRTGGVRPQRDCAAFCPIEGACRSYANQRQRGVERVESEVKYGVWANIRCVVRRRQARIIREAVPAEGRLGIGG